MNNSIEKRVEEWPSRADKPFAEMSDEEIEEEVRRIYQDMRGHPEHWKGTWRDARAPVSEENGLFGAGVLALECNSLGLEPIDYLRDLGYRIAKAHAALAPTYVSQLACLADSDEGDKDELPSLMPLFLADLGGRPERGDVFMPNELEALAERIESDYERCHVSPIPR